MEFKGKQRAERYSKGSGSVQSYSDFLNGYNTALEDSKSPEMLEMLIKLTGLTEALCQVNSEIYKEHILIQQAKQLIKEATDVR